MEKNSMKILSVGNSFAWDTMMHMAQIAGSAGIPEFKFAFLYIGGCSIDRHYRNITEDRAEYVYHVNTGEGWTETAGCSIRRAVEEDAWDIISIQHGTGDGSWYTRPESYRNLQPLIQAIRELAGEVKIAFNMTWIGEPESTTREITFFNGDQQLMYRKVTGLTESLLQPMGEIDCISPTGTAIQNARTVITQKLTRDDYHLSLGLGRYIAALTFLKALCGLDLSRVGWRPDGVTEAEQQIAVKAADAAIRTPYRVTQL